jgi:hypothetical protein
MSRKDYQLENIRNRELKLKQVRGQILSSESEKALDLILDAPSPATLVQSFPDEDLYYLMHKIGPDDFVPILSMATSSQWEYILDVDTWDNDRILVDDMTRTFDLLFQADPQRLLRWVIKEKPDFFEFYLFKQMEIVIREHDEPPPADHDDYITLDDKFYFRFPDRPRLEKDEMAPPSDHTPGWELTEKMVKAVAEMDLSVFHGLMLETQGLLTAETEEEQFRQKTIRLAEKGFLPSHEAVGIYQPAKVSHIRKRPGRFFRDTVEFDPDIPLPPQFFSPLLAGDNLLVKALQLFSAADRNLLESEMAALINKIISADKIKVRAKENIEAAVAKACDYINLGFEVILKDRPEPAMARQTIEDFFLEDIFRAGSQAGIALKTKAANFYRNSFISKSNLPLSFLDEHYLGVLGGLLLDRPQFYDKHSGGNLFRNFKTLKEVETTDRNLEQIIGLDLILSRLDVDVKSFTQGVLTYKTLILTLWAKDRIGLDNALSPITVSEFRPFFSALFTNEKEMAESSRQLDDLKLWIEERTGLAGDETPRAFIDLLGQLIDELDEEYSSVTPDDIDPRFIPHFLLTRK